MTTNTSTEVPGHERAAKALRALGVSHLFGVMGIGNIHVVADHAALGGRYVSTRHEAGAVNMADGAHRATGAIGVATVIQGPGLTNAVTAITTAARSGSAILVITSELPLTPIPTGQAFDQALLIAPTGAAYVRVDGRDPGQAVLDAARQAQAERRPVVVCLTGAVQRAEFADEPLVPEEPRRPAVAPSDADVEHLVGLLEGAERPVLLAGRGAASAAAAAALAVLAQRTGALLGTTLLAKDLFRDRRGNLGIVGGFAHGAARDLLVRSDLVVSFGASLTTWTVKGRKLFPDATLVQTDHVEAAFAGPSVPDVTVLADAALLAEALAERCASRETGAWEADGAVDVLARWQGRDDFDDVTVPGLLDPREACVVLGQHLPAGRRLSTDAGHHFGFPAQYIPVRHPDHFHHTSSFGAIGQGLGVAIGAAFVGEPGTSVVVLGDGGFATSIADLETAVRERASVLVVVLDDQAYGAEIHHLRRADIPDELGRFPGCDLAAFAEGFGCPVRRVETPDQLAEAVAGWTGDGPLFVSVPIDGEVVARWYEEVLPPPGDHGDH